MIAYTAQITKFKRSRLSVKVTTITERYRSIRLPGLMKTLWNIQGLRLIVTINESCFSYDWGKSPKLKNWCAVEGAPMIM